MSEIIDPTPAPIDVDTLSEAKRALIVALRDHYATVRGKLSASAAPPSRKLLRARLPQ